MQQRHPTLFGECFIAVTERGICHLSFLTSSGEEEALLLLKKEWPSASIHKKPKQTLSLVSQIFSKESCLQEKPFHLLLKGTNFQIKVWGSLLKIPFGSMVSYKKIAEDIVKPKAVRAVASAIANNSISFLIPCHRVITSMGKTHHYRWGDERKKIILGWEASRALRERG